MNETAEIDWRAEATLERDAIAFDYGGTWKPENDIKYYWWSPAQNCWCVISKIEDFGKCIYVRTPEWLTTVILPDLSWFRPLKVVDAPGTKYDGYALLDRSVHD